MSEILLPPNHVTFFFRYLNGLLPAGVVVTEEPDGEEYAQDSSLVIVKDGGQRGPVGYTFWDCLTTFEVRHADRGVALEMARKVDAVVRGVPDSDVHYLSSLNNPVFTPDAERRIPIYEWTVEHRFRGEKTAVEDIRFV